MQHTLAGCHCLLHAEAVFPNWPVVTLVDFGCQRHLQVLCTWAAIPCAAAPTHAVESKCGNLMYLRLHCWQIQAYTCPICYGQPLHHPNFYCQLPHCPICSSQPYLCNQHPGQAHQVRPDTHQQVDGGATTTTAPTATAAAAAAPQLPALQAEHHSKHQQLRHIPAELVTTIKHVASNHHLQFSSQLHHMRNKCMCGNCRESCTTWCTQTIDTNH